MDSIPLRKAAARGVLVIAILKGLGTIADRLAQIILPLYLLPSDFGLFALALLFSSLLSLIGEFGMSAYLVREKDRFPEAASTAFTLRAAMAIVLVATSVVLGWIASFIYSEARLTVPVIVLSLGILVQAFAMVPRILALRDLNMAKAAVPDSTGKITGVFLTIGLAVFGFAYWSPIYGTLFGLILGTSLQIAFSRWRPIFRFDRDVTLSIVRFGQFVTLSAMANLVAHSVDNAIVGFFLGVTPLGYYVVAYSWGVTFVSSLSSVINSVTYPIFSRVSDSTARMRRVLTENFRYYTYLSLYLSVGIVVFAPTFVLAFYGDAWQSIVLPMQILALAGLLIGYSAISSDALNAVARPRVPFVVFWEEAILILVLAPPATILFGIVGTSCAALLGAVFVATAMTRRASRTLGGIVVEFRRLSIQSAIVAGSAAIAGGAVTVLSLTAWTTLLLGAAAFSAVYIVAWQVLTDGHFLSDLKNMFSLALR